MWFIFNGPKCSVDFHITSQILWHSAYGASMLSTQEGAEKQVERYNKRVQPSNARITENIPSYVVHHTFFILF